MNKWYGKVGFAIPTETSLGVWQETITEQEFYGDIIKNSRRNSQGSDTTNDDISLNVSISILSNEYSLENSQYIKYVEYMGAPWKVTSITPEYPRLALVLGGVYNGPRPQRPTQDTDGDTGE